MIYSDIHSHLVPGVDDGARDEAMSTALLRQAAAEGIGLMIVTPHNYPDHSEKRVGLMKERFRRLREIAAEETPGIELFLGNEVFYRDCIIEDLEEGRALSMAGTHWVLTEFHPWGTADQVTRGVRRIVEGGYRPIIAHVERIEAFDGDIGALEELREMGARLQVNSGTLMGGMFDRRSKYWRRMCQEGLISFLGSDAHHPQNRPVRMREAAKKLSKIMDSDTYTDLCMENARRVLSDERIR